MYCIIIKINNINACPMCSSDASFMHGRNWSDTNRVSVNSQIAPRGRVGLSADLDRKSLLVAFPRAASV